LIRNGVEVAVASSGGPWENDFSRLGIKTFRVKSIKTKNDFSWNMIAAAFSLHKIRKEFDFQIVHSHTRVAQVAAGLYCRFSKAAHVANFHGFYKKTKTHIGRKLFGFHGDYSIAITPQVGDDLVNSFGADRKKVRVILSGIDFERLEKKVEPLRLTGWPRIGASGRLSAVKGFRYLVAAMPQILRSYPDAALYILGEGQEEDNLLQLAADLNVGDCVQIIKKTELPAFLKAIDIFCLPSLEEPLGLSVIEAQYFGIPCIVSDVDGLKILVEHGTTGFTVPHANFLAISHAVTALAWNDRLRSQIGLNCKNQVREKFDLSKKVHDFIAVYKEALNENTGV
jgi:glycosyltransferase involved in cell wall biosynthesis